METSKGKGSVLRIPHKRNEIIHKGKLETDENDAKKAFIETTTIDFIRSIVNVINK